MSCMGKREIQFLRTIADGLSIGIDDGLGSGGPAVVSQGDFDE